MCVYYIYIDMYTSIYESLYTCMSVCVYIYKIYIYIYIYVYLCSRVTGPYPPSVSPAPPMYPTPLCGLACCPCMDWQCRTSAHPPTPCGTPPLPMVVVAAVLLVVLMIKITTTVMMLSMMSKMIRLSTRVAV